MILAPWLILTIAVASFGLGCNLGLWIKRRDRRPDPSMMMSNSEYRFALRILEQIRQAKPADDSEKISRIVQTLREERPE